MISWIAGGGAKREVGAITRWTRRHSRPMTDPIAGSGAPKTVGVEGTGGSTTGECNSHRPVDDGPGITASPPPSDTAGQLVDVAGWMGT